MNKLALYLITLLGLCLTQPMANAMSVQWTDYGYDNNGNVTELYDGDSGKIVGQYEYDPYGNTIKAEGQAARENKIRFSTKEYDSSTGLYYYGYRYYDPVTGRWPSRDPIEERGGLNLYGFVENNGVGEIDAFGLYPCSKTVSRSEAVKVRDHTFNLDGSYSIWYQIKISQGVYGFGGEVGLKGTSSRSVSVAGTGEVMQDYTIYWTESCECTTYCALNPPRPITVYNNCTKDPGPETRSKSGNEYLEVDPGHQTRYDGAVSNAKMELEAIGKSYAKWAWN
jgi:RHS repeat-associated protein